jgi:universal stress protein A
LVGSLQRGTGMNSTPPIRRILVPHDFGDAAEAALVYAIRFASAFGARITLLHAFDDPAEGADAAADLVSELEPDLSEKIGRQASKELEKVAAPLRGSGVEITTKVRCGRPWREIDSEATEGHFDLMVIGTHGRTGVAHALLGSVAEKIVRTAPCPVLTVRGLRR